MTKTKRITISFKDKDTHLIDFINHQSNASLSIRIICKRWVEEHGVEDVIDSLTTGDPSSSRSSNKTISSDLDDDNFDVL